MQGKEVNKSFTEWVQSLIASAEYFKYLLSVFKCRKLLKMDVMDFCSCCLYELSFCNPHQNSGICGSQIDGWYVKDSVPHYYCEKNSGYWTQLWLCLDCMLPPVSSHTYLIPLTLFLLHAVPVINQTSTLTDYVYWLCLLYCLNCTCFTLIFTSTGWFIKNLTIFESCIFWQTNSLSLI
jgi:hypothetical protein